MIPMVSARWDGFGYVDESDVRHSFRLIPEFADGKLGGYIDAHGIVLHLDTPAKEVIRPAREIVGWRVHCKCESADGSSRAWISDQRWIRAALWHQHDPRAFRLYAPDDAIDECESNREVEDAVYLVWEREHFVPIGERISVVEGALEPAADPNESNHG